LIAAHHIPLSQRLAERDSVVVTYSDGSVAHVFLSTDEQWRITRPVSEVDPDYIQALIALEDGRFWKHRGVDPLAVGRAFFGNLRSGRTVSGASTITMQLARLLEPRPRTMRSKVIESFRAMQLERHFSKEEILETYLRFLPFGRNIEGIEAASLAYFGHTAEALSPHEIAALLAVPQAPLARHPSEQNRMRLERAQSEILTRLIDQGVFGAAVLNEPSPAIPNLRPFPRDVSHGAYSLRRAHPSRAQIVSTLDKGVQRVTEEALANRASEARGVGIDNVAVVVVEHELGAVRGLVGNFEFGQGRGGFMASYDAPRSPGSALKPFIYAAAIDRGLAMPDQLVLDVPFERGAYIAENYSGTFSGLLPLEEALAQSLNIPFIHLLESLGVEPHLEDLRQMGARHLRDDVGHYGLSLAVGAVEATPMELASFYATLARQGRHRPLHVVEDLARNAGEWEIFSPGASWLTTRALSLRDRPDFPQRRRIRHMPEAIAWKTGTSTGNRDAWAAGFAGGYTVVVWMGNLNNHPHPALIGSEAAAPLLFDILGSLEDPARRAVRDVPEDLVEVAVCRHSGHLPTRACPERRSILAPRKSVAPTPCPFHVLLDVDTETGELLTPECRDGRSLEAQSFLIWPPSVVRWLSDQQRRAGRLPLYAPGCAPIPGANPPRITSPARGQALILLAGLPPDRQRIPLRAEASLVDFPLSWFVDGAFIGHVDTDTPLFWQPTPGRHRIAVSDRTGRTAHQILNVRLE
ncbi:MAG: penicillin-binding protein 1C, partial [Bradymonadaceae bacterium]